MGIVEKEGGKEREIGGGGTKHSAFMLIFCKFILLTPFINMEDLLQKVFYLYKRKKTDYMHGFLFLAFSGLYLFCEDRRLLKGLDTFITNLGFFSFANVAQKAILLRRDGRSTNYINI